MSSLIPLTIVALLFLIGLAGTVIPGLPGIGLIFAGIIVYAFATSFTAITLSHVLLFAVVAGLALAAHYAGSVMGARAGGGGAVSTAGTLVGALLGTFTFGPPGLFGGAFFGALAGALYERRTGAVVTRVAVYSVVGIIGGTTIQLLLGISMIVTFIWLVI